MRICLADEEISLELLELKHAEALFRLTDENREQLGQWLFWANDTKVAGDSAAFIRSTLQAFAEGKTLAAAIMVRGELAGVIDYHAIVPAHGRAEIGYWLGQAHQGQGIMTRACRAFIGYGWSGMNLNRIVIMADVENAASRAIPERLGFTLEGVMREWEIKESGKRDMALYSILRSEWAED
ncbi:GNAT family N-acetyltransferase [Paenibacillus sp. UNC499MF]|uniref:GNAT family N-acetyltransferase n=1 Tax=Paenibacillus sp. UNC499MF TaxID=1502751 RepID=UPI0008A04BC0|nr:GNAT family protein [Paenibacillus sp. UNC499MF]SEG78414.1 ribosomal-protein-serine acetyltransferase [Paenibacillus sp. UNC499MF]